MATLPVVGSDSGAWGTELNTWLLTSRNADGTLKTSAAAAALPGAVDSTGVLLPAAIQTALGGAITPIFNVKALYGARGDGSTDDQAAINAAIVAANAAGGGVVYFPAGIYRIGAFLSLLSNVTLQGCGRGLTTLRATTGLTTGVVVCTSGNAVTDAAVRDLSVDGDYAGTALSISGIQATTVTRLMIDRVRISNVFNNGILIQTNSTDCSIERCWIKDTGLGSAANGFGVIVKQSTHVRVRHNWIFDARGMSIGANTTATDLLIEGNYLDKTNASTFENIGITSDCSRAVIANNHSINSKDNGISCSADRCTVTGNVVDSPAFSGIALAGTSTVVTGNMIRNIGQINDGGLYAGILVTATTNCVITGNRIYDDQGGGATTRYGIKEVTTAGGHRYTNNRITGPTVSQYLLLSNTTSTVDTVGTSTQTQTGGGAFTPDATTSRVKRINVTDATAFTVNNPANVFPGARLTFQIINSSGGAMGVITWQSGIHLAGSFTNPANTKTRTITFFYSDTDTAWIEESRAAADI